MRILLLVTLTFLAVFPVAAVRAAEEEDNPRLSRYTEDWTPKQADEWRKILPQLRTINASDTTLAEQCVARWNILWPLAKTGNLQARNSFYFSLWHRYVNIPDYPSDMGARNRIGMALYMHSRGAPEALPRMDQYESRVNGIPYNGYTEITEDTQVMECLAKNEGQKCARLAVERNLIPSFEELAAEIDLYLQNGKTFQCPTVDAYGR